MPNKNLILLVFCALFIFKNTAQAQAEICTRLQKEIYQLTNDSLHHKTSIKKAELLLDSIKNECPRTWQLLSAHLNIGKIYEQSGKTRKAITHYKTVANIENPMTWELNYTYNEVAINTAESREKLAKLYLNQQQYDKADKWLLKYLKAKRQILTCGHSVYQWRSELIYLQLLVAFGKEDYEDAYLLMCRFTNTYWAISTDDERLFPFFLEIIEKRYTAEERQALLENAIKSIANHKSGLVAKYDLIKIAVRTPSLKKKLEYYHNGTMRLKYVQKEAQRTFREMMNP